MGNAKEDNIPLEFIDDGLQVRVRDPEDECKENTEKVSGAGQVGWGPPRRSHFMGKDRGYHDGWGALLSRTLAEDQESGELRQGEADPSGGKGTSCGVAWERGEQGRSTME